MRLGDFNQSEIHQHRLTLWCDANVGGFDIAVEDGCVKRMQVDQRVGNLGNPFQALVQRNSILAFNQAGQVLAFHEIHHQVLSLVGDEEMIDDARQIRMGDIGQDSCFTSELALCFCRNLQVFFYRTPAIQVVIPGPVNCAEATTSELDLDAVASL